MRVFKILTPLLAMVITVAFSLLSIGCSTLPEVYVPNQVSTKVPMKVRKALENPLRFEFLTLDPEPIGYQGEGAKPDAGEEENAPFHGYQVLGRVMTETHQVATLVNALYQGIDENDGTVADCFNPRHGIRAWIDGSLVELVICFECHIVLVFVNGESQDAILTTSSPAKAFNALALELGLTIATK